MNSPFSQTYLRSSLRLPFSSSAVRKMMRDLIAGEAPEAPLSDAAIAEQLSQQGMPLARRTVTKYRSEMRIPPFADRRDFTASAPPLQTPHA